MLHSKPLDFYCSSSAILTEQQIGHKEGHVYRRLENTQERTDRFRSSYEVTYCVKPSMHYLLLTYTVYAFTVLVFRDVSAFICLFQWPRSLRRRSVAARLPRLWVRIPLGAWIFVCCECCVLSGRGLCDELITRPEESYQLWCVVEYDLETSWMRRSWPIGGCSAKNKQTSAFIH